MQRDTKTINAQEEPLGRVASEAAHYLQGKHKPSYLPYKDMGDAVKITNAADIKLTGNKKEQKKYFRHTNFPGGIKETSIKQLLKDKPEEVMKKAVSGMIPKNKLHEQRLKRLQIEA